MLVLEVFASCAVFLLLSFPLFCLWRDRGLVNAARGGDIAEVRRSLSLGADPRRARFKGLSALEAAAYRGDEPVVRLLLDAGEDPSEGVCQAILMGRVTVLEILIAQGANVRSPGPGRRETPLQFARNLREHNAEAPHQQEMVRMLERAAR